jgi:hypothetical protein
MCTVTFFPAPAGFTLTHNRDEAPSRSPQHISREKTACDTLLFPRDTKAGGAWVATAKSGKTACLLNGAFVKHRHEPPYRRSRGLMLLDFFEHEKPDDFFNCYDLDGIEPFTFLFFQKNIVTELRWDGAQRHLKNLPPDEPHFWCSATLYPPEMQARREQVFRHWLANPQSPIRNPKSPIPNPQSLLALHRTGSVGDPENDFVMNRSGKVRTVSITQVVLKNSVAQMRYFDLMEGHRDERRITARERQNDYF